MQITQKKVSHLSITARKDTIRARISSALQETAYLIGKTNFHGGDQSIRRAIYTAWAKELRIARNSLSGANDERRLGEAELGIAKIERFLTIHKASTERAVRIYFNGEAQMMLALLKGQEPRAGKKGEYDDIMHSLQHGSVGTVLGILETLKKKGIGSIAAAPSAAPMLDGEPNELMHDIAQNIDTLRESTQDARVELGEKLCGKPAKLGDGVLVKLAARLNDLKTQLKSADTDGMMKIAEEAAKYGALLRLVTRDEFEREHGLEGIADNLKKNGVAVYNQPD